MSSQPHPSHETLCGSRVKLQRSHDVVWALKLSDNRPIRGIGHLGPRSKKPARGGINSADDSIASGIRHANSRRFRRVHQSWPSCCPRRRPRYNCLGREEAVLAQRMENRERRADMGTRDDVYHPGEYSPHAVVLLVADGSQWTSRLAVEI